MSNKRNIEKYKEILDELCNTVGLPKNCSDKDLSNHHELLNKIKNNILTSSEFEQLDEEQTKIMDHLEMMEEYIKKTEQKDEKNNPNESKFKNSDERNIKNEPEKREYKQIVERDIVDDEGERVIPDLLGKNNYYNDKVNKILSETGLSDTQIKNKDRNNINNVLVETGFSDAQSVNTEKKMNINNVLVETGLIDNQINNIVDSKKKKKEEKQPESNNNIDKSVLNKLDKIMKPNGYQEKINIDVDKSGKKKIEFPDFLNDQSFDPKSLNQYYKMPDISITVNNDGNSCQQKSSLACNSQKKSKQAESKQVDSKKKESKQVDSKKKESKQVDSKQVDSKKKESKQVESKKKESKKKEFKKKESKQIKSIKRNKPLMKHNKYSKKCNINNIENHHIF